MAVPLILPVSPVIQLFQIEITLRWPQLFHPSYSSYSDPSYYQLYLLGWMLIYFFFNNAQLVDMCFLDK